MQNPQDRYNFLSQCAAMSGCERCLRPRFTLSQGTLCVEIFKMHEFKKELLRSFYNSKTVVKTKQFLDAEGNN